MNRLLDLSNIGQVLEKRLHEVEIHTIQQLKTLGAKNAFLRIQRMDSTACLHILYALEGAIQGVRYTQITENKKQELKMFYKNSGQGVV